MIRCGLYEVDITPALGMDMPGYFCLSQGKGILERLSALTALFEDARGGRVLLCTMDAISMSDAFALRVRADIAQRLGMDASCVLLCATHTHTGGPVETWGDFYHEDPAYLDFLARRLADAAELARQALRPVRIGYASGEEHTLAHCRNFILPDGGFATNSHVEGQRAVSPIDPQVGVLRIDNEDGSPYGLIANYACHCDSVDGADGNQYISSDYPGAMRARLREIYGADFLPLYVNGFCGDLNHIDFEHGRSAEPRYYRRMGRILAAAVSQAYESAETSSEATVAGCDCRMTLPSRVPTAEELEWARTAREEDAITRFYAAEALRMDAEGVKPLEVTVQALRIGDLMIYGLPGEIYVEFALDLKARTKGRHVMTANLANGFLGYVPIRAMFRPGVYESRICCTAQTRPEAGYDMTDRVFALGETL